MTILLIFHKSYYRYFETYYLEHVLISQNSEFPGLVIHSLFVV